MCFGFTGNKMFLCPSGKLTVKKASRNLRPYRTRILRIKRI